MTVPSVRIRSINDAAVRNEGEYVLYWMVAFRRTRYNFALQRAAEEAARLGKPLLVLEALRAGYRWASDRLHRFAIDGMADNARACADAGVAYHAYLEPEHGDAKTLLADFSAPACLVVTDDFPAFFIPRMLESAGGHLDVKLECVDANGLLPMRSTERVFSRAVDFRRYLQKSLLPHLEEVPVEEPLETSGLRKDFSTPKALLDAWPKVDNELLEGRRGLDDFAIDHSVPPSRIKGGAQEAGRRWKAFVEERLDRYHEGRNDPDDEVSSGLSPHLHWGHISTHELFADLVRREDWKPSATAGRANGKREGWWGFSSGVEAFLDELVTWRELGFNMASHRADYDEYASLPEWARTTLEEHLDDERPHIYDLSTLERAETHDEIWNAAQRQLLEEGRIHNYLRMLWGKKILEWSETPQDALAHMVELNNKYGLDGRDPNSYSGIFWVFGRYDRAWGPERPIYGKVRYMTSASTRKKLKLQRYLDQYGPQSSLFGQGTGRG